MYLEMSQTKSDVCPINTERTTGPNHEEDKSSNNCHSLYVECRTVHLKDSLKVVPKPSVLLDTAGIYVKEFQKSPHVQTSNST